MPALKFAAYYRKYFLHVLSTVEATADPITRLVIQPELVG